VLLELIPRTLRALWRSAVLEPRPQRALLQLGWCWLRFGASLYTLVAWHAWRSGPQTAVAEPGRVLTYQELQAASEHLAARLFHSFGQAKTLGILCRNHLGFVETLLACGRLGLEAVLLNPGLTVGQLAAVCRQQPLDLIVCDLEFEAKMQGLEEALKGQGRAPQIVFFPDLRREENRPADKLPPFFQRKVARITVLTSGTTGPPKLVRRRIGLGEALGTAVGLLEALRPRKGQPVLLTLPLLHGHGLTTLGLSLAMGSPLHLSPRADARELLMCIEANQIEVLVLVPTVLYRLLEHLQNPPRSYCTDSLEVVVCGSAPLDGALASHALARFGPVLFNLYGLSETGILSLATPQDLQQTPATVGRALPGVRLQIVSGELRAIPGQVGEVLVSRSGQAIRTGDLGYLDTQGRLFLQGRADDLLICGGQNLYPESYEAAIVQALNYVAECAVTGIPDPEYGQALHLWMVLKPDQQAVPLWQIEDDLARLFPRTLRPRYISLLEALPRNLAGKILRRLLALSLPDEVGESKG